MNARAVLILIAWLVLLGGGTFYLFLKPTEEEEWCKIELPDLPFAECIKEFGY